MGAALLGAAFGAAPEPLAGLSGVCEESCVARDDDNNVDAALQLLQRRSVREAHPEAALSAGAPCPDEARRRGDDRQRLHVIYATDLGEMEGLLASIPSVILSTKSPLTVHLLVRKDLMPTFRKTFWIRPECRATLTASGALIVLHTIDDGLVSRAATEVGVFGAEPRLNALENYARYYAHTMMERTVVVCLDPDTIVHRDLAGLRDGLRASGATVGFVARPKAFPKVRDYLHPGHCPLALPAGVNATRLYNSIVYNNGVYVADLERWAQKDIVARIEGFAAQQRACNGTAYTGGAQAPMLLAFLARPEGEPVDAIVFNNTWNTGDLGYNMRLSVLKLRRAAALHWNGADGTVGKGG